MNFAHKLYSVCKTLLFRLLGYYSAWSGLKPTFRDSLSAPSSRTLWPLNMEPTGNPKTSVSNHLTPRNNPEGGRIQFNCDRSLRSRMGKLTWHSIFSKFPLLSGDFPATLYLCVVYDSHNKQPLFLRTGTALTDWWFWWKHNALYQVPTDAG